VPTKQLPVNRGERAGMAPKKMVPKAAKKAYDYSGLEEGMKLQVSDDGTWYACEVVTVSKAASRSKAPVKVTYKGYDGYDEWVSGDRIRSKALKVTTPEEAPKKARDPVTLNYFPLWAKGPAPALALNHSGIEWTGVFVSSEVTEDNMMDCWKKVKPETPWGSLPIMEVPGVGKIGHELAILQYIGRSSKKAGGVNLQDTVISQQLMHEAEEIYAKLTKFQPTPYAKDKPKADCDKFWSANDDKGLPVFLAQFEKYHGECDRGPGKFTRYGVSVGECKLWATLHALKLIKDDALKDYPALTGFYDTFAELPKTKEIVESGGKMPGPFKQYFQPYEAA